MNDIDLVHRLLYMALIELRAQGQSCENPVVFHLADLFHGISLQMGQAAHGECTYRSVLLSLRERAREGGHEKWLNDRMDEFGAPG